MTYISIPNCKSKNAHENHFWLVVYVRTLVNLKSISNSRDTGMKGQAGVTISHRRSCSFKRRSTYICFKPTKQWFAGVKPAAHQKIFAREAAASRGSVQLAGEQSCGRSRSCMHLKFDKWMICIKSKTPNARFIPFSDGEVISPRSPTGNRFLNYCLCDLDPTQRNFRFTRL